MFLTIAVVLILMAVYGIWHYSPLRYLTQSPSEQTREQPLIITKKIKPTAGDIQTQGELPQALVVLKQIEPEKTPEPAKPQAQIQIAAADEAKASPKKPADSSKIEITTKQPPETAKPVKPPAPARKVAAAQSEPKYPYSIMLSSCKLPQSARIIVSEYQKAGLAPYVVKVKFESGDEWLRVLAGHYPTRQDAIQAKKDHRLSGAIVKKTPYTNLIGTYKSSDEMQADLQKIKKLGYSPYFLKKKNVEWQLVVGAFVTREGAENLQAELQTRGIQNTIIKR